LVSLVSSKPSQFFHSTRHCLIQAFVRSTIHRLKITTNPCLEEFSSFDSAFCSGVILADISIFILSLNRLSISSISFS
jgi:hypothetical protein